MAKSRRGRSRWSPYVPVSARGAAAARFSGALIGEGVPVEPVVVDGRQIARTFWGRAWCGPDWAVMCKHVAAVLYGVGARLDEQPELLFVLRGVDHEEMIDVDAGLAVPAAAPADEGRRLAEEDLGDIFGIELNWERSAGSLRVLERVRAVWPDLAALTPEEAQLCLQALAAAPAAGRSRRGAGRR